MAPPSDNVWVGNLPAGLDTGSLEQIFQAYGQIIECKALPPRDPTAPSCGMIRFATVDMASWVVENLNNNIPEGLELPIVARFANAPGGKDKGKGDWQKGFEKGYAPSPSIGEKGGKGEPAPPSDNVWMGNLPDWLENNTLHSIFSGYGQIVESRVLPGREPGGKACAMIRFVSVDVASWIVENLNNNIPEGLSDPILVRFANAPGQGGKGKDKSAFMPPVQEIGGGCGAPAPPGTLSNDNVWFGDLPPGMDKTGLEQVLSAYGQITSSKMLPGKDPSAYSCAMVRFASAEMALWVVENLNGNIPEGLETPIVCRFANAPGEKGGKGVVSNGCAPYPGGAFAPPMNGKGPPAGKGMMKGKAKGGKSGFRALMDSVKGAGIITSEILPEENQVYIRGLPADTTDLDLYRLFAPFGAIAPSGVKAMMSDDRLHCKGVGFVDYLDANTAATVALSLDGHQMPDGSALQVTSKTPKKGKGDGKGKGPGKQGYKGEYKM